MLPGRTIQVFILGPQGESFYRIRKIKINLKFKGEVKVQHLLHEDPRAHQRWPDSRQAGGKRNASGSQTWWGISVESPADELELSPHCLIILK